MNTMTIWNIEQVTGYKPKTTFWSDFCIAEAFGVSAIKDTYERAFQSWKNDVTYLTELSLVLNHKIWYWYERDENIARVYDELWTKVHSWAYDNLTGDDFTYYWKTTD